VLIIVYWMRMVRNLTSEQFIESVAAQIREQLIRAYEWGWDEGYGEGIVTGQQELVELYGLEPTNA